MAQHSPRWLPAVLAVVISGLAYYVSTGLGVVWPVAWIAPVPILVVAFKSSARASALCGAAAFYLGSLNLFTYLSQVMPVALVAATLLIPAAAFAGAVLAARYAVRRLPPWAAAFVYAAAWTSYEFLLSLVSPHGTALSLAYSQTDFLLLLQLASVTGIWGITFLAALAPAAIAVAWTKRAPSALAPALAIGIVVLGYGILRLHQPEENQRARVGLAATDRGIVAAFATKDPAGALAVTRAYADRVARLAAQGAQVVVLPEKFVGVTPADSPEILGVLRDAARAARATVVAGLNRVAITPLRNVAVVFAPDGRLIAEYDKHHMLPGPETGYLIGRTRALFSAPAAQWGVAVCKDMDFPAWARGYARRGVRILAVPAWDFVRDARLHSRMAVVRGVENGFAMARAAQQGFLTCSDGYGRILAETPSANPPDALLVRDIAPGPGTTFYTRFGDWFGWAAVIGLAALLAAAFGRRPRS